MIKKLLTALYVSLLVSGFYLIAGAMVQEVIMFAGIVFVYTAIGTIIYGIPVSYLSDLLTKKMQDYRLLAAGLIHLFFGAATVLFIDELAFYAVLSASLFFVINEWLHRKERSRKKLLRSSLAIAAFLSLSILGSMGGGAWGHTLCFFLILILFSGFMIFYDVGNKWGFPGNLVKVAAKSICKV
ncbi:hypothetical protein [Bacillus sp. B15-48]|uniref:hypothetical protein n=1 Tax=Bacillus sp. B15-48 TaxID=1548601 RepID=UPI00193FEC33|nr:hypothetical protein [Bacillus sp. B15-48]MBM4763746.1 hypothetical protein [Bacillus sp. B15-48]